MVNLICVSHMDDQELESLSLDCPADDPRRMGHRRRLLPPSSVWKPQPEDDDHSELVGVRDTENFPRHGQQMPPERHRCFQRPAGLTGARSQSAETSLCLHTRHPIVDLRGTSRLSGDVDCWSCNLLRRSLGARGLSELFWRTLQGRPAAAAAAGETLEPLCLGARSHWSPSVARTRAGTNHALQAMSVPVRGLSAGILLGGTSVAGTGHKSYHVLDNDGSTRRDVTQTSAANSDNFRSGSYPCSFFGHFIPQAFQAFMFYRDFPSVDTRPRVPDSCVLRPTTIRTFYLPTCCVRTLT